MIPNNLSKRSTSEHSRISKIQSFLRSNTGFKIGIIIISFVTIVLIEFGLIMVLFLGDFLGSDFLMSYAKHKMIFVNTNEVPIAESTNQWFRYVFPPLLFRIGFLSLLFGIIIGIFSSKTSSQLTFHSRKRLQKYLSILLMILGVLFLIFPF